MDRLERETKELPPAIRPAQTKEPTSNDYLGWYASPFRANWKLGWYDSEEGAFAETAKSRAKQEYNAAPYDMLPFHGRQISQGDHLIQFLVRNGRVTSVEWLYSRFLVRVSKHDKAFEPHNPWQAVQVHPLSHCQPPPFTITTAFRKAFAAAVDHLGVKRITASKSLVPSKSLLLDIAIRMGYSRRRSVV